MADLEDHPPVSQIALTAQLLAPNRNFHPELDFVRVVAVFLVLLDHTMLALRVHEEFGAFIGTVGVWMFFVHTALVLMWSLERKPYTLDFYIRRIFRIYPLALFAIILALITKAPVDGTRLEFFHRNALSLGNVIATSALLYNLFPVHLGYHAIVNVIWSLPLEVQMYVLLPGIFAFAHRERTIWSLLVVWCLSIALAHLYFKGEINFITSIPNFLPGIMAFVAFKRVRKLLPPWFFPIFLFGLIGILCRFPKVTFGWFFTLALGLSIPFFRPFARSRFTIACNHIAKYSYGVYLMHPFCLVLAFYLLRGHSLALQFAVALLSIAVTCVASYHLLEKPFIDLGSRFAARLELRSIARHPDGDAQHPLNETQAKTF